MKCGIILMLRQDHPQLQPSASNLGLVRKTAGKMLSCCYGKHRQSSASACYTYVEIKYSLIVDCAKLNPLSPDDGPDVKKCVECFSTEALLYSEVDFLTCPLFQQTTQSLRGALSRCRWALPVCPSQAVS